MSLKVDHTKLDIEKHNGNIACHFFKNLSLSSVIMGMIKQLLLTLAILQALSSDFPIGSETFYWYAKETIVMYLQDFG
jgi:hypothetical protein